jgi:hypothetical protein
MVAPRSCGGRAAAGPPPVLASVRQVIYVHRSRFISRSGLRRAMCRNYALDIYLRSGEVAWVSIVRSVKSAVCQLAVTHAFTTRTECQVVLILLFQNRKMRIISVYCPFFLRLLIERGLVPIDYSACSPGSCEINWEPRPCHLHTSNQSAPAK